MFSLCDAESQNLQMLKNKKLKLRQKSANFVLPEVEYYCYVNVFRFINKKFLTHCIGLQMYGQFLLWS